MRLLFLTSGEDVPSSRFRVLPYIPHLESLGHECIIKPCRPDKYESLPLIGFRGAQFIRRLRRSGEIKRLNPSDFDAVFLERELLSEPHFDLEKRLRDRVKRLVLDVDDGIFVLYPEKYEQLACMSDKVIAGNQGIADYTQAFNDNISIIPTCLDLERFQFRYDAPSSFSIIGWTGKYDNVRYLAEISDSLIELQQHHEFVLHVISESPQQARAMLPNELQVESKAWNAQTEIEDLRQFNIGLMPLSDTEWTRYKCGLKILQYMALGIPAVASPVGVNAEIIVDGENGFLVESSREWSAQIRAIVEGNIDVRSIVDAARQTVEDRYSIASNVESLVAALSGT